VAAPFTVGPVRDFFLIGLPRNLTEATTPLGGERVLPLAVQHMVALLRRNGVERYRTSPMILGSAQNNQRLLEGAWPIRPAGDASSYLALAEETLPAGCQAIDRLEEAVLARCP
jgi:hypothetical protein